MSHKLAISLFVHAIRSDWNNGNAHFLRGLARWLGEGPPRAEASIPIAYQGHQVTIFEPENSWSLDNLLTESTGQASLLQFERTYPDLKVISYKLESSVLKKALAGQDIVIVHEWSPPELINCILSLRDELGFRALFHDTHHRASSDPEQLKLLQVERFDGVIAFGEALRSIYRGMFGLERIWVLHEAADSTVFYPREGVQESEVVWIGNWGDNERTAEIREFLLKPATMLRTGRFLVHGVRYPQTALDELAAAGIHYGGYLPNLAAPEAYAGSQITIHIPRQHYARAMVGIPTIRIFEALASGIPLISAPWEDTEGLFSPGDMLFARSSHEMIELIESLLSHPEAACEQTARGLSTVLARHTCAHRAFELTHICEEVLS